jgi:hypothetical protein
MTLPNEELTAMTYGHRQLVDWLYATPIYKIRRKELNAMLRRASKHYPPDSKIRRMWQSEVCLDCGKCVQWCKCGTDEKGIS